MKLYLSSIRIPSPEALAKLIGKPLGRVSVALIPNAKDYYFQRERQAAVGGLVDYMERLGMKVSVVDLRAFSDSGAVEDAITGHDLVWAMGGNTYMLRYEMHRSGFEDIIGHLLRNGVVYGGDSAGALVAGTSIGGVESADDPSFAEVYIEDGLKLVPWVVLPHVDNPEFRTVLPVVRARHPEGKGLIELNDDQAVIFDGNKHWIVDAESSERSEL